MELGNRIAALRQKANLSQEAFAQKLGVPCRSVTEWESGESTPDTETLSRISELFDVSLDHLVKGSGDADVPPPAAAPGSEPSPTAATKETLSDPPTAADETTQALPVTDDGDVLSVGTLAAAAQQSKGKRQGKPNKKKLKKRTKRIIALVTAVCLLASLVGTALHFGWVKKLWWALHGGKVQYTYVLVHGLGSFDDADGASYWGGSAGNLAADLREAGYAVCVPRVGPISSTWDRACELYAQLTGTTVDYGEAHAKQHGHARFGRSYDTAMVPDWGKKKNGGQLVKINLVGHSYGGTTARLLTSLLANGDAAECRATEGETSPLFTGGKGDWVNSVTTLAAPHDGTSLTCALNAPASLFGLDLTKTLFDLLFKLAGVISSPDTPFDFMLDQFDIAAVSGTDAQKDAVTAFFRQGTDNAGYDLSPDGANERNQTIGLVDGVYYFSFAYRTTKEGMLFGGEVPTAQTHPLLMATATVIGNYTGTSPGGIQITDAWRPNDGLVSIVSALYPGDEAHLALSDVSAPKQLVPGVWYVQPLVGDHGTPVGLDGDMDALHTFWTAHFERIDALER